MHPNNPAAFPPLSGVHVIILLDTGEETTGYYNGHRWHRADGKMLQAPVVAWWPIGRPDGAP